MPHSLLAKITYALFAGICVFALWKGDRHQRQAGGVLLIATLVTPVIQDRVHWMDPEARFFIEDSVLLAFFLWLALWVGRAWMIAAAAFQLLSWLSHPAAHLARAVGPTAYIALLQAFSYGVFLTLGGAVALSLVTSGQRGPESDAGLRVRPGDTERRSL